MPDRRRIGVVSQFVERLLQPVEKRPPFRPGLAAVVVHETDKKARGSRARRFGRGGLVGELGEPLAELAGLVTFLGGLLRCLELDIPRDRRAELSLCLDLPLEEPVTEQLRGVAVLGVVVADAAENRRVAALKELQELENRLAALGKTEDPVPVVDDDIIDLAFRLLCERASVWSNRRIRNYVTRSMDSD